MSTVTESLLLNLRRAIVAVLILIGATVLTNCHSNTETAIVPPIIDSVPGIAPDPLGHCPGASCFAPYWSPDGSQIVVSVQWPWQHGPLAIGNADLTRFKALIGTDRDQAPVSGGDIPNASSPLGQVVTRTVVVNQMSKPNYPEGSYFQPAWSPAGNTIAFFYIPFTGNPTGYDEGLYLVDVDGHNMRLVVGLPTGVGIGISWSQDGTRLLYTNSLSTGMYWISTINKDGSDQRKIKKIGYPGFAAWSPDNKRIAYVSDGNLYVMNSDGTQAVNLTGGNAFEVISAGWSPDNRRLIFSAYHFRPYQPLLYVVNVDGTSLKLVDDQHEYSASDHFGSSVIN
jgi:dipeptidyl aminopeptidase/acylaminoacyl peptidase